MSTSVPSALPFCVDGQVQHVAGVMAFGTLQSVLLAVGVEVWTCGFEIGSIALGVLVNVDTVVAGREVVEVELEADARSFRRHDD